MATKKAAAADTPEREIAENVRPEPAQDVQPEPGEAGGALNGAPAGDSFDVITMVYIGPSLPYGKLRTSMVLKGTEQEIRDFLADIREKYPEADHLIVPPEQLTQALEKVTRKGTILHKYYEDMLAKSRASRKG